MDRNVEYILEVARCGGITRAAENLFITTSALSKYVITLEEQLSESGCCDWHCGRAGKGTGL